MGSEQSSHSQNVNYMHPTSQQTGVVPKLTRGYTIAVPEEHSERALDESNFPSNSRPVSPPISVCSDSDLPYISYTDRPIGDSPKYRNKIQSTSRNSKYVSNNTKKQIPVKAKSKISSSHNVVVVNPAVKEIDLADNDEIKKLKSIPTFLPVIRGSLSLPANRDPEVLERLQPVHLRNMCSTMQIHLNTNAKRVVNDQSQVTNKMKEVDSEIQRIVSIVTEKQKLYSSYAEHFSKIHQISQQLCRCNTLLNQNIESMEQLNLLLELEERLEPFIWKTN